MCLTEEQLEKEDYDFQIYYGQNCKCFLCGKEIKTRFGGGNDDECLWHIVTIDEIDRMVHVSCPNKKDSSLTE